MFTSNFRLNVKPKFRFELPRRKESNKIRNYVSLPVSPSPLSLSLFEKDYCKRFLASCIFCDRVRSTRLAADQKFDARFCIRVHPTSTRVPNGQTLKKKTLSQETNRALATYFKHNAIQFSPSTLPSPVLRGRIRPPCLQMRGRAQREGEGEDASREAFVRSQSLRNSASLSPRLPGS